MMNELLGQTFSRSRSGWYGSYPSSQFDSLAHLPLFRSHSPPLFISFFLTALPLSAMSPVLLGEKNALAVLGHIRADAIVVFTSFLP